MNDSQNENNPCSSITLSDFINMVDSSPMFAVYVVSEAEHKVLYYNAKVKQLIPDMEIGKVCYQLWDCDRNNCPIIGYSDAVASHSTRYESRFGCEVDVFANRFIWHDNTSVFLIRIVPRISEKTNTEKVIGFSKPTAIVPIFEDKKQNEVLDKNNVKLGKYSENIYFLNGDDNISAREQSIIDSLLLFNQGVGIVAGYFDDDYSISMISELAIRLLKYVDYDDFYNDTKACLLNMISNNKEREFLKEKLTTNGIDIWSFPLQGKDGVSVSVRISNTVGISPQGKKMWYLSLRQFNDHLSDSLTGGFNHEGFIQTLKGMRKQGTDLTKYAVLYIDIHGFKSINTFYGSISGDNLLIEIYKTFLTSKLQPDICARKDSDHYLLLVKKDNLHFDELRNLLDIYWNTGDDTVYLHAVCGIYNIENPDTDILYMIDHARIAYEQIQDEYATPYMVYNQNIKGSFSTDFDILSNFDKAIEDKEFSVYYQPIIDINTNKVAKAEALVRWSTNKWGIIYPDKFIPEIERRGFITRLDHYMFREVKDYLLKRNKESKPIIPISINLSQMDFFNEYDMNELVDIMKNDPFLCKYIHLEITESAHATIQEKQHEFIESISDVNGGIILDDFGTGTASMAMLIDNSFNSLKVDMKFISDININHKAYLMVKMTVEMCHELGIKVIAEGVETKQQLDLLKQMKCDYVQGYYYSKPLDEESFDKYLLEHV